VPHSDLVGGEDRTGCGLQCAPLVEKKVVRSFCISSFFSFLFDFFQNGNR